MTAIPEAEMEKELRSCHKPPVYERQGYPYADLDDRQFEILLYYIFKAEIENDVRKRKYDRVSLMPGVGERGRDCVLTYRGANVGLIQCKNYTGRLDRPGAAREIIKFALHSLKDRSLISDQNNFTYHLAVSSDFTEPAILLLDNFNDAITDEADFEKWTTKVINENKSLADMTFAGVKDDLAAVLRSIRVEKLTAVDLNLKLKSCPGIASLFFEVQKVTLIEDASRLIEQNVRGLLVDDFGLSPLPSAGASGFSLGEFSSPPVPQFFVGRHDQLEQLTQAIQHNNTIVIGGLAGIGKTYLMAQFVKRFGERYPVLWLDCDSSSQLEHVLGMLANSLDQRFGDSTLVQVLRSPHTTEVRRVEAAVAALEKHKCIFVWDGFDQNENQSLLSLLTLCNRVLRDGKLLVTTRESVDLGGLLNPPHRLTLSRLDKESGIGLMHHFLDQLGLGDQQDDVLARVYERVDGHPYFLIRLVHLSEWFSISDLLDDLPNLTTEAYAYIHQQVFEHLDASARQLLERLSVLRTPFRRSAVEHLSTSLEGYDAFVVLLKKFLVTRQNKNSAYYEIHNLVREFAQSRISDADLQAVHKQAVCYYRALPQRRYLDGGETVYHALEAGMPDDAAKEAENLLGRTLYYGRYDLVLEITSHLLADNKAAKWGFIHHARGRALRFKEQWPQALEAYQNALDFAMSIQSAEAAKIEIASVLVKQSQEPNGPDWETAKQVYTDLLQSENIGTRISALDALGHLNILSGEALQVREGIRQMQESLVLAESAGLHRSVAHGYYGLGMAYYRSNDYDKAIEYLERGRSIKIQYDYGGQDIEADYYVLDALARAYVATGQYADAVHATGECVKIDRKLELEERLVRSLYHLGREQCMLGQYDHARDALQESLSLVEKHNIAGNARQSTLEWLAVALWHRNEFELAIECILEHIHIAGYAPFVVAADHDLMPAPDTDLPEFIEQGLHLLVLRPPYTMNHVRQWNEQAVNGRPELAHAFPILFQKPDVPYPHRQVGRNDPCPCGSGKKYKYCCLKKPGQ